MSCIVAKVWRRSCSRTPRVADVAGDNRLVTGKILDRLFNPHAGEGFLKGMKEHLEVLRSALLGVDEIRTVGGFGNCTTGWALEGRFSKKADGGDDSLATQLRAHIVETQLIIDTVEQSIKNFRDMDAAHGANIKAKTQELS